MKRIMNLFIIMLLTTISVFSSELKGTDIGEKWILSKAKGIDVISKESLEGNAVFSIGNINGQLVAIITNKNDTTETNQQAVPVSRELQVLGLDDIGYKNNSMLVGNNYFQYLEYWQLLNLNVEKIKIVMQDRANKEVTATVDMKGYINALKKIYTEGKNSKGENKYIGYQSLNNGWQYRETAEYKEISKEFKMLSSMEKDYGQLRNRIVIRNYNGVLWGGFELARPFDMRSIPSEVDLYTENSGDNIYVVSPVGSLDGKQQNIKITVTENAIKEMTGSKLLTVNIIPTKDGESYDEDDIEPSEIDLTGFGEALNKLGKYRLAGIEDFK